MAAVRFERVTKSFPHKGGQLLFRQRLMNLFQPSRERIAALDDVSFAVERGESLAVIGPNGAGKSTLLNLAAGLSQPDSGVIEVRGSVAPLLDLDACFHPDLTGAENVRVYAALMGLGRREIAARFGAVVDFAGVREFLHEPLRTWSAGMWMRLAFSVAVSAEPDVLIIDEILGVADQAFHAQCLEKIQSFRGAGKTILLTSHAAELVRMLSDRALWLDHGRVLAHGETARLLAAYRESIVNAASS